MRAIFAILVILTLGAAYAAGRYGREAADSDLSRVASFRESLDQSDPLVRSYRFSGFLQTLGPDDLEEALEAIEKHEHWLTIDERRDFLLAWASFDARAALDWALSRPRPVKRKAVPAAMHAWAFYEPAGARQALESLDKVDATLAVKEALVSGWMQGEAPTGVVEYIASQPASNARQKYTSALASELMREGPEAVIRWAEAIPDDAVADYKSVAFQKAANVLAVVDPFQASRWIEGHLDRDYAASGPRVIARRWFTRDPTAALEWLVGLPAGEVRDDSVRTVFRSWLKQDAEQAKAWVLSVSPVEGADRAVRALVHRDSRADPVSALAWAQRIHDPTLRQRALIKQGQAWFRRDPEAARAWLAESELSEDIRTAIQQPPESKRRRKGGKPNSPAAGGGESEGGSTRSPETDS